MAAAPGSVGAPRRRDNGSVALVVRHRDINGAGRCVAGSVAALVGEGVDTARSGAESRGAQLAGDVRCPDVEAGDVSIARRLVAGHGYQPEVRRTGPVVA